MAKPSLQHYEGNHNVSHFVYMRGVIINIFKGQDFPGNS
jgi:hypothetical protein